LAELGLPAQHSIPHDHHIWTINLQLADLSTSERLAALGLSPPQPSRRAWPRYQQAGEQLWRDGWPGLLAPSAARPGSLIACLFDADSWPPLGCQPIRAIEMPGRSRDDRRRPRKNGMARVVVARMRPSHCRSRMLRTVVATTACTLGLSGADGAWAHGSLSGRWRLDEGAGQRVRDSSGNHNDGMLGSTPGADAADPSWFSVSGRHHSRRSALRFNGANYVTVPGSATLEPARLSVSAVVRASASPGPFRYVVSKGALQCVTASYGLYTGTGGGIVFYVSNGVSVSLSPDAGAQIWDGGWHRVRGTFDGGVVRLYVDGRQVGTGTPSDVVLAYGLPDNDRFYIGDYRGTCTGPLGFVGDIDAVRVGNLASDRSDDD
jgi:hypothetical protein